MFYLIAETQGAVRQTNARPFASLSHHVRLYSGARSCAGLTDLFKSCVLRCLLPQIHSMRERTTLGQCCWALCNLNIRNFMNPLICASARCRLRKRAISFLRSFILRAGQSDTLSVSKNKLVLTGRSLTRPYLRGGGGSHGRQGRLTNRKLATPSPSLGILLGFFLSYAVDRTGACMADNSQAASSARIRSESEALAIVGVHTRLRDSGMCLFDLLLPANTFAVPEDSNLSRYISSSPQEPDDRSSAHSTVDITEALLPDSGAEKFEPPQKRCTLDLT